MRKRHCAPLTKLCGSDNVRRLQKCHQCYQCHRCLMKCTGGTPAKPVSRMKSAPPSSRLIWEPRRPHSLRILDVRYRPIRSWLTTGLGSQNGRFEFGPKEVRYGPKIYVALITNILTMILPRLHVSKWLLLYTIRT